LLLYDGHWPQREGKKYKGSGGKQENEKGKVRGRRNSDMTAMGPMGNVLQLP